MNNIVEISDLSFSYYDGVKAIKNLTLNIRAGSYTALLGHNGSGKSTLSRLLVGLLIPDSGKIIIDGIELNKDNIYQIRDKVGIVFQNPDNQFIGSTVADDIAFGLENHCVEAEKMQAIIDEYSQKVGMDKFLDKEPTHLSGGQKQRVAIAGVLAMAPKILIFDEATSMLDPKGKADINDLIRKAKEIIPDITIISITHDIEEACFADELIVLNKGEIYAQGTPQEIFKDADNLKKIGLDVPFANNIQNKLKEAGIEIEASNREELVRKICQLK